MNQPKRLTVKNIIGLLVAALAWCSIGFQFYITPLNAVYYLSYFTTLCNLLIAVSLTLAILFPSTKAGIFFSSLSVQSAIALYIFIVSLVYNTVLRGLLVLDGWEYILDNMVHVVVPIAYIIFWIFFRTPGILHWKNGISWLLFPFFYLLYSLIRGSILNWYPYPFLNANRLGYPAVFKNIGLMMIVFLVAALLLIGITRLIKNKSQAAG